MSSERVRLTGDYWGSSLEELELLEKPGEQKKNTFLVILQTKLN